MRELGSFLELEIASGKEYITNALRLNSGRAAICHACLAFGCKKVYLPYYQCPSVGEFLKNRGLEVACYRIDGDFNPILQKNEDNSCVVLVNYFGIMGERRMRSLASGYKNVIIDNSQAFFAKHIENTLGVYSARKFFGVPDGAYVTGIGANGLADEYKRDYSSDTSLFLLLRHEYGCAGKAYENRMANENRIDQSGILLMSTLTQKLLDGVDYKSVADKRKANFEYARTVFGEYNLLDTDKYFDSDCVPMVYPLLTNDKTLTERMQKNGNYQGNWWKYLCELLPKNSFECRLSEYMTPVTTDQRVCFEDLQALKVGCGL